MALFTPTPIAPSPRTQALLQWETAYINRYLAGFKAPGTRQAVLDSSGEFIRVLGFPLPRGFAPTSVDMVIIVADFPQTPPYGLYLLRSDRLQVEKITALFGRAHVQNRITPEAIPGYAWICYHYQRGRWSYRPDAPDCGDNLAKFLRSFYVELEAGTRP